MDYGEGDDFFEEEAGPDAARTRRPMKHNTRENFPEYHDARSRGWVTSSDISHALLRSQPGGDPAAEVSGRLTQGVSLRMRTYFRTLREDEAWHGQWVRAVPAPRFDERLHRTSAGDTRSMYTLGMGEEMGRMFIAESEFSNEIKSVWYNAFLEIMEPDLDDSRTETARANAAVATLQEQQDQARHKRPEVGTGTTARTRKPHGSSAQEYRAAHEAGFVTLEDIAAQIAAAFTKLAASNSGGPFASIAQKMKKADIHRLLRNRVVGLMRTHPGWREHKRFQVRQPGAPGATPQISDMYDSVFAEKLIREFMRHAPGFPMQHAHDLFAALDSVEEPSSSRT